MSFTPWFVLASLVTCTAAFAQPCVPNPPANVSISSPGCSAPIIVNWTPSAGAVAYQIFRGTTPDFANASQIGMAGNGPIFDDSVPPLSPRYYWVKAFSGCGVSDPAGGWSGMRLATPAAPTNVQASFGTTCHSVAVTWNASFGASEYRVYRNTGATTAGATLVGTTSDLSFRDASAPSGLQLYYFVDAGNFCGRSSFNAPGIGRVGFTPNILRQPSDTTAEAGGTVRLVSWAEGDSTYSWTLDGAPLSDIPGRISGTTSTELTISNATPADAGAYRLVAVTPCGTVTSNRAVVTVKGGSPCPADFNNDGGVDGGDVQAFFSAWESGDPSADVSLDGGVDGGDLEVFFVAWIAGGC